MSDHCEAIAERLTDEQRAALDDSLADSGCHGFQGDHPELYAVVERIIAARIEQARAGEGALRERVERALAFTSERGVSCGGLSIDAEGCFAGDLAARIRAALTDTDTREGGKND